MFFLYSNRQEWESAVYKGSNCFQTLEEERLAALKDLILKYHKTNKDAAPKLVAVSLTPFYFFIFVCVNIKLSIFRC